MKTRDNWRNEHRKAYRKNFRYSLTIAIVFHLLLFLFIRGFIDNDPIGVDEPGPRVTKPIGTMLDPWQTPDPPEEPPPPLIIYNEKPVPETTIDTSSTGVKKTEGESGGKEIIELDGISGQSGGVVSLPRLIKKVIPDYPERAQKFGIEGEVKLRLTIDKNGDVTKIEVSVSSGSDVLDREAKRAAKKCKFMPGIQNGNPVEMIIIQPYKFILLTGRVE